MSDWSEDCPNPPPPFPNQPADEKVLGLPALYGFAALQSDAADLSNFTKPVDPYDNS
jgi:hypothetical protein